MFAVVALDGLRPNIVFEYGILHGKNKPVLLFKEGEAKVDIRSFLRDPAQLSLTEPSLDLDSQFSDIKDVHYATWNRYAVRETVRTVWEQYRKKKDEIRGYIKIDEAKLWQ